MEKGKEKKKRKINDMTQQKKLIKVKIELKKGEVTKNARIEFPHPWYVKRILEVTDISEQKKYKLHYFNNILVSKNYSEEIKDFLKEGGKKLNLSIEFL